MQIDIKTVLGSGYLTLVSAVAIVCILPLYGYYLPPFMILWGIAWLIENKFCVNAGMFRGNKVSVLFILFILMYLWQIAGVFSADSLSSGFERIVKRLSFLLFPLVLFSPGEKIKSHINLMLRLFALSTLLYIMYCFGNAIHSSITLQSGTLIFNPHPAEFDYENFFLGNYFSGKIHPTYFSMYVLLSALIALESLFDSSLKLWKRICWLAMVILFLVVLYLLSSRAGILAAIISLPVYFLKKFKNRYSGWIMLSGAVVIIAIMVLVFRTNTRISFYIEEIRSEKFDEQLENDIRYSIWKSAFGVIGKNLIFGVGTGDASAELKREFITRGYVNGYYDNLNAHNQFLEILLENGLIGLLLFLLILGYMIYLAYSQQSLLYGLFIMIILIFFLFETILNRLSGVTFFPLFSFLLIYYKSSGKT